MSKRQVLAITAIRSEYFLQRPIFQAIMEHSELELALVVAGAHLSDLHNFSVRQVEADGFPIVNRIENLIRSDHDADRVKGTAVQLEKLSEIVDARRPDWLLAPADREESINMAICGTYLRIATAHYGAGDRVVGNNDDMIRHAVSRLSHLLFTTNQDAYDRLVKAGEQAWRVHNVGHSGIDRFRLTPTLSREDLARELGVEKIDDRYLVIIQHPLSSEMEQAGQQMRETVRAALKLELQTFISYPNSDPGSNAMIGVIEEHRNVPRFHIYRSIPDVAFVNLLRNATALVGNSSLGLLEAPYLHLPVVNVGARQQARHHSENVFFVSCDNESIVEQVRSIMTNKEIQQRIAQCSNPFGDGHTGERVADLLASTPIDANLLNKDLRY
jgi:GDP/UDP-N,N'-diacetylbacillosamine 2-epimerase (hydrolysing)